MRIIFSLCCVPANEHTEVDDMLASRQLFSKTVVIPLGGVAWVPSKTATLTAAFKKLE